MKVPDKGTRFSDSLYYDPKNTKDIVIVKARCEFLYVVVEYEPSVLEQLVEKVSPLGPNGLMEHSALYFDFIADIVERLSKAVDEKNRMIKYNEWIDQTPTMPRVERFKQSKRMSKYSDELLDSCNSAIESYKDILSRKMKLDSVDRAESLTNFYKFTNIHRLGSWALSLLLQYIEFCERRGYREIDPADPHNLLNLAGPQYITQQFHAPAPPSFKFTLLSFAEYHSRLGLFEETKNTPMVKQPLWFYDYKDDEYISFQLSYIYETSLERAKRTQRVFKEVLKHHEGRCKQDAESRELLSYEKGRERASSLRDRYYWLYLYLISEKTVDEIQEIANQTAGKERQGKTEVPDVKRDLRKLAERMAIPFVPFG